MTAKKRPSSDYVEPKTFEEALERLQALVESLEEGDVPLEESLAAYEEGQKLIAYCQKKLLAAESTIKSLSKKSDDDSDDDDDEDE